MSEQNEPASRKKYLLHYSDPAGTIGGTLILAPSALPPSIRVVAYGGDEYIDKALDHPSEIAELRREGVFLWVNVDGLGNGQIIYEIGRIFGLHPLALEDVGHCHQRAKVEEYDDHTFVVSRLVEFDEHVKTEQACMFLGKDFLITFQERPRPKTTDSIRDRLRRPNNKLRRSGPDYLAYTMLDALLDSYFPVLDRYAEHLEGIEEEILRGADDTVIEKLHSMKTELLLIRRALWPHREAINALVRDPNPAIQDETRVYLRDCYDHLMQLFELVETYRELTADLRDLYLSSASHRMNEIMKLLTIVSTIFMPLGFICGLYGMNFDTEISGWNLPETKWAYGYPYSIALMVGSTICMLFFFRRRGWLGRPQSAKKAISK